MRESIFLICVLAVTVYLAVTAWEDHKTCEVTRWKHLIGGIPAIILYCLHWNQHGMEENAMILAFAIIYVAVGFAGIYGFADGLVLANLSLFFGSIGGATGCGVILLIMIIAAFSFLICHVVKSIVTRRKVFQRISGALIPHILVGYLIVMGIVICNVTG